MWDDDFSASRVLIAIGKDVQKPAGDLLNFLLFIVSLAKLWELEMFWNVNCVALAASGRITLQGEAI